MHDKAHTKKRDYFFYSKSTPPLASFDWALTHLGGVEVRYINSLPKNTVH